VRDYDFGRSSNWHILLESVRYTVYYYYYYYYYYYSVYM